MFFSDVSRTSEISIQCYLRKDEPKRGADGLADDMGHNDIFMGSLKVTPDFDNMGSEDQWYHLTGGSGKVKLGTSYQPTYVGPMPIYA
jgi:serum/glucocorticoid-regulated kinase 2